MQHIKWHIGCSGFYYREWKGIFYPEKLSSKNWFAYYAQHFNTLEINNTFYRFPEQKLFDNWYDKALPGFSFSVKVPQIITHYQKFRETEKLLHDFYIIAREGLKEKLGPVLFQLPPSMKYDEGLLQAMISQMHVTYQNVIEFRHISWWRKEVFTALKKAQIIFCGVSYPGLISDAIIDLPTSYYRFHGVPKLYYSAYEHSFIERIAAQFAGNETIEAYVYFNNTAEGAAIENARFLQYLVGTST
ncbi:MAG TPA: DUF72 domain-containing protein [Flavisolibacter sp.]|jgi:uncharacterized protein YecE (DUF72 family)|nr:DUF72 domain-containing protein [Flavisolibacter sp.]